jgi:hypothetical protein
MPDDFKGKVFRKILGNLFYPRQDGMSKKPIQATIQKGTEFSYSRI